MDLKTYLTETNNLKIKMLTFTEFIKIKRVLLNFREQVVSRIGHNIMFVFDRQ